MPRERKSHTAVAVLCFAAAAACAPNVSDFTVADGEPGERLAASARVRPNQTSIQSVTVATGAAGSNTFDAEQSMTASGSDYSGQTLPHLPGSYDARLTVRYIPGFQSTVRTVTRTLSFALQWPDGTFAFENASAGLDGWTMDAIRFANTGASATQCTPVSPLLFTRSGSGWPLGIGDVNANPPNGSLRILIGPTCFPQSSAANAPQWQFNLRSPDLANRPEWQGIGGVSFRAIVSGIGVQAQATVVYEGENGQDAFASPTTGNTLDFANIGNQWNTVTRSGYVPAGRPIRRVLIRVFGVQGDIASLGEPATMLVDVVQPVP